MSAFKPQQRRLMVRGRALHFVSYEGRPANPRRGEDSEPAMWYLMVEGRRFPAFACDPEQELLEVDRSLARWAEKNAMGPATQASSEPVAPQPIPTRHRRTWWGPN